MTRHLTAAARTVALTTLATLSALLALPAQAQSTDGSGDDDRPRRTRVAAGVQFVPAYPGADSTQIAPLFDLSRARGDDPFRFESADESFGFPLVRSDGFSFGPAIGLQGKRSRKDTDRRLPKVGFTVEPGAFVQYDFSQFRLRAEGRQGVGGHKGFIADLSADYVARDGDAWLFAIGPRVTLTNGRYQRAYFGVPANVAPAAGLPAYRPSGGVQSVGVGANGLMALSGPWGLYGYARYDRLVGDAGRSPVVRALGDRDQLSGGLALTYTFGG